MALVKEMVRNEQEEEVAIYIEVDDEEGGYSEYDGDELRGMPDAHEAFAKAMQVIHTCAGQVVETIHKIPEKARPAACEVQFSVKICAGIAVLAKATSEAQLQVTLKWGKQD